MEKMNNMRVRVVIKPFISSKDSIKSFKTKGITMFKSFV